ncbi:MAG TPA: hypothetical protein GX520_11555 [Syntrophaceticus sp.]|jgi:plasmid segregation protein ParM|nr:hypothetical protein [Syntrophaceticus sp.]
MKKGVPIPMLDACGSIEAGIYLAQRSLAEGFENKTGAPLPQRMYQRTMELVRDSKPITYKGQGIDLLPEWRQAQKEIVETISSNVLASWGDRTGFLDMTVFAGGGSVWFGNILDNVFSNTMFAGHGVFANAVGYLLMATGMK